MLSIAVCDDENTVVNQIETFLCEISEEEHIPADVDVFYSGRSLLQHILEGKRYDLIYLDIQMEGGDGITAAEKIRETDENVLLVYVSGYEKYMMELFRLDVLAFIKKPVEKSVFEKVFLDANRRISRRHFYFTYRYNNEEFKISCMDILYFESRGRKIVIHLKGRAPESFNGKLSHVEAQMNGGKIPFLRTHKSYLVNYHYIRSKTKNEVTLTDGTALPISKNAGGEFGKQYGRLLGGEIDA